MTIPMKRWRPTLDSVRIIPKVQFSALLAAWEADPAGVDLAAAELIAKVQRGLVKCYVCAQLVGLRAQITLCETPSGFRFAANACGRCRRKMGRDEKFAAGLCMGGLNSKP